MAKTFAKIAKTFARLSMTIIAIRRRPVLILHLEAKYAKIDYKNEIYAKNWVRSTWTAKSQLWQKSTVKVNRKSKSTVKVNAGQRSVNNDVAVTSANDVAMMTSLGLTSARGPWRVEARGAREILCRIFWRRVRAHGSSNDGQVSTSS